MARYTESDQGTQRDRNEDYVYSFKLVDVFGLVVADGLGGHNAGHVASDLAARTFGESFQQLDSGDLDEAYEEAVQYVKDFDVDQLGETEDRQ
jgi:serine/threonine protein phosphatase PrpC